MNKVGWLQRIWPRKLLGQMVLLVIVALLLAQGINLWLLSRAHEQALMFSNTRYIVRQFASAVDLINQTDETLHPTILRAWQRPGADYALRNSLPKTQLPASDYAESVKQQLIRRLGSDYQERVKVFAREAKRSPNRPPNHSSGFSKPPNQGSHDHHPPSQLGFWGWWRKPPPALHEVMLAVQLNDGSWLLGRLQAPDLAPLAARTTFVFLLIALVLVLSVVYWQMRRITRPLRQLSLAAEQLGRGATTAPLKAEGPQDIQQTIQAFNRMQKRIERFVSDRTQMLAALSHDLRTPITSMRLRLELMADSEEKHKLLQSLDEMQQMSEASLSFVRDSGDREETRSVDINALLDSLCEDLHQVGMAVQYLDADQPGSHNKRSDKKVLAVRPVSLKRAVRNLIENAVAYGEQAQVSLQSDKTHLRIAIQDSGPGIPSEQLESVMEPFQRLERSRNRDTGGMGLGLSIARQIVMAHGGELRLSNTSQGLLAEIILPR